MFLCYFIIIIIFLNGKTGLLQKHSEAIEALQISCLLLPPENRRKLQLLVRMMARISFNKDLPPLSESVRTRVLVCIVIRQKISQGFWSSKSYSLLLESICKVRLAYLMNSFSIPVMQKHLWIWTSCFWTCDQMQNLRRTWRFPPP